MVFLLQSLIYLWAKARISAARPVPSKMTTGTGGDDVTYSSTDLCTTHSHAILNNDQIMVQK